MELEAFRKKKWLGQELTRFLCLWLRVERNMSTFEIAKTLGLHVNTVRFTQKDFIEHVAAALTEAKRGGRKRELMTIEEEAEFLAAFEGKSEKGSILTANAIRDALEKHLSRKVHKTTVYRMLHRHGWRKIAPRPYHPKRDGEAAEAFKKGASLTGQPRPTVRGALCALCFRTKRDLGESATLKPVGPKSQSDLKPARSWCGNMFMFSVRSAHKMAGTTA